MKYCLVCWGDKELSKTRPRRYCLKCAKDVRRKNDRKQQRLAYKIHKEKIKERARNYYYTHREQVLEYKNNWYQNKVLQGILSRKVITQ